MEVTDEMIRAAALACWPERGPSPSASDIERITRALEAALEAPFPPPLKTPEALRQSLIGKFDACPLSARFALETELRQPSLLAARGTLAHRFFKAAIEHMVRNQERSIPVEVAMEILLEVISQVDVPDDEVVLVPMRELRWLRVIATKFARDHEYSIDRVVDLERRLYAEIPVFSPDGEIRPRKISGQLDLLLADPPDSAIVVDYKTGHAPAPRAYSREGRPRTDKLSDLGYAQQMIYGLLVLLNFPSIQRVALREFYVMSGEVRMAWVDRYEVERIQDVVSAIVAQFDAAVAAGVRSKRWLAVPGTHCSMCPRPRSCPVRREVRIPTNEAEAVRLAGEWHASGKSRESRAPLLRGWIDAHGPLEIDDGKGRKMVAFRPGSKSLAILDFEDAPDSPFDKRLEDAARERGVLVDG